MSPPRAAVFMLAFLAAGVCTRLAYHQVGTGLDLPRAGSSPAKMGDPGSFRRNDSRSTNSESRPSPSAILSAIGATRLRLLMAWLPGASDEELLSMAGALANTVTDETLSIRLLMARWAEVNPQALLSWSKTQPLNRLNRDFLLINAIESWARVDFEAAWAAASAGLQGCRESALLGLASVDPKRCLQILTATPSLLDFAGMEKVLSSIAVRNPQGAAALLDGAALPRLNRLARRLAETWVKSDLKAAVEWIKTLPLEIRTAALTTAGEWIAAHSPDQVAGFLEGMPRGSVRSAVIAADFQRLAASEPRTARERLDAMPAGPQQQYCRALLMHELFKDGDAAGALELAGKTGWRIDRTLDFRASDHSLPYDKSRESPAETLKALITQLAASDPTAAAAVLALNGRADGLAFAAAEGNPAAVASALAAMKGDRSASSSCRELVAEWARKDAASAAAWMDTLPPGSGKSGLTNALCSSWVRSDPGAMVAWAAGRGEASTEAWRQIGGFAPEYALAHLDGLFAANIPDGVQALLSGLQRSPELARQVMRQMPDDLNVPLNSAMTSWLKDNSQEASTWVAGLPAGTKRDNAAHAMANWLYTEERDYEAAFRWAATLPPGRRELLIRQSLGSLKSEDPARAAAAIRASSLSPEDQRRYIGAYGPKP